MLAQEAAALLGMAVHEVVAVVDTADGPVIVTHDGTKTLVRPDGSLEFTAPPTTLEAQRASLPLDAEGEATLSAADAAKRLGMAAHEVVSVHPAEGGHVVVTHDGHPTLITDAGELVFGVEAIRARLQLDEPPAVDDEDEDAGDGENDGGAQTPAGETVPEGTIEVVLAWVGDDKDKAAKALEVERARPTPRSGLLAKLEALAGVA